ncbi:hypothetical protein GCM10011374_30530 [Kocuria dechangensis]|uniref:Uncharacterized protein n=1 Tax=Kocuria dechangensis TaxID=1176249 RepID=A0A917H199_9MICC|nr:hypothetical protein [Kocuria dechangensis]GGG64740.1 hypothetical protein GCM10011374_30530 [Kocuria dechangensis]
MTTTFSEHQHPRTGDGKFTAKNHPEADLSLSPAGHRSAELVRLLDERDDTGMALTSERRTGPYLELSALYQHQSAKLAGIAVRQDFPDAAVLVLERTGPYPHFEVTEIHDEHGEVIADAESLSHLDHPIGESATRYDELGAAFMAIHDNAVTDVEPEIPAGIRPGQRFEIDLEKAAAMDASPSSIVTARDVAAHQLAQSKAVEARRAAAAASKAVTLSGLDLLGRSHPGAATATFKIHHEDTTAFEVDLYDAGQNRLPTRHAELLQDLDRSALESLHGVDSHPDGDWTVFEVDFTALTQDQEHQR